MDNFEGRERAGQRRVRVTIDQTWSAFSEQHILNGFEHRAG